MNPILLILAAAPSDLPPGADDRAIVVTASREPVDRETSPESTSVLSDQTIESLSLPVTSDLLRLTPGLSVSVSGPPGSQTQVRIRGAEANHTLLFVDGIRMNDPAAGNEARFELLNSDSLSRIEVVRGPQSALWGSEAIGGVAAAQTPDPSQGTSARLLGEYGSLDSSRASAAGAINLGRGGISGTASLLRSDGIDSMGIGGDKDGFRNLSGSLKAVFRPSTSFELGAVGHVIDEKSQFDGLDPLTGARADTLDSTHNHLWAGRAWGTVRWGATDRWSLTLAAGLLGSSNRNRNGDTPLNRTAGRRTSLDGQLSTSFGALGATHHLILALDHEHETFKSRDQNFGATDQDQSRDLTAFTGEWRTEWGDVLSSDFALRHDGFSDFADATTFRAGLSARLGGGWSLHGAYGEGIAQPTFYDLFGFFPGTYIGNPDLKPERSTSWEAGVRWQDEASRVDVTFFTSRLKDEIVSSADFLSALNAAGTSHRKGIEVEASHSFSPHFKIDANYTWLSARERILPASPVTREVRRPRHSANLVGTGTLGPVELGASLAYVGARRDTDFDFFPAPVVSLHDYMLGTLNVAWNVTEALQAYGRVQNAFNSGYQDVIGYNTAGRTVYAGLRLRFGR